MNQYPWQRTYPGGGAFLPKVKMSGPWSPARSPAPAMVAGPMTMGGQASMGATMGKTAQEWYEAAGEAIRRYEFLLGQVDEIGSNSAIDAIELWLGDVGVEGTPAYRYNAVRYNYITTVAAEGVGAYNVRRRQGRVTELQEFNDEFTDSIERALQEYGTRRTVTTPGEAPVGTELTLPIVGAGAAVVLAIALLA